MKRNIILFIEDIMENLKLIEDSTKNLDKAKFKLNRLIIDATARRLEIIGEAAKNVPNKFREKYPKVPWKRISGLRDILTHAYFNVKIDRIWEVIKRDLPKLKREIKKILENEK
jgi:uncharacterized protein with HEPN domain